MSRLFKQIQQAQPQEPTFIQPLGTSFRQKQKFNLLPFVCIVALFMGIIGAYFYTNREAVSEVDTLALPIQENAELLAEDLQQPFTEIAEPKPLTQERDFENVFTERAVIVSADEPIPEEKLVFQPLQWDVAPIKDWLQSHWEQAFSKFQDVRESLIKFAYFDVTQPIPEKEISALEKERLELIRRFLKKFKVDAVRIDGAYSRVMANGQAFYVNTTVSQRPRLKLTGITSQEMIFKDEYNQEYKKEISQND